MKSLLLALPLLLIAVSCNNSKDAATEFNQQKEEVNREFNEEVQDLKEERSEDLKDAREDLKEEQKEEAIDYVEDADGARIERETQNIEVDR
jgi:hypothetical protein